MIYLNGQTTHGDINYKKGTVERYIAISKCTNIKNTLCHSLDNKMSNRVF